MNMLNMLGGSQRGRGGMSPAVMAVLGVLAYRTLKGKGRLAELLQGSSPATGAPAGNPLAAGLGGGALLGGLKELLDRFRQNNPNSAADSWVLRDRTGRSHPTNWNAPWATSASNGSRSKPG